VILAIHYGGQTRGGRWITSSNKEGQQKIIKKLKVQEANPRSGILQSAVVSLFATYLVFSAILRFAL